MNIPQGENTDLIHENEKPKTGKEYENIIHSLKPEIEQAFDKYEEKFQKNKQELGAADKYFRSYIKEKYKTTEEKNRNKQDIQKEYHQAGRESDGLSELYVLLGTYVEKELTKKGKNYHTRMMNRLDGCSTIHTDPNYGFKLNKLESTYRSGNPFDDMKYYHSIVMVRNDGSFTHEIKWNRREKGETIEKVENIHTNQNGYIEGEVHFGNGETKSIVFGKEKGPEIIYAYRDNYAYKIREEELEEFLRQKTGISNEEHTRKIIYKQGTDLSNTAMINIPENGIVVTDAAMIEAHPELKKNNIVRIDKNQTAGLKEGFKELTQERISTESPEHIYIYEPSIADHVYNLPEKIETFDINSMKKYLLGILSDIYPESEVIFAKDEKTMQQKGTNDICIIDRHAWNVLKQYPEAIVLPIEDNKNILERMKDAYFETLKDDLENTIKKYDRPT